VHGLRFSEQLTGEVQRALNDTAAGAVIRRISEHTFAIGASASSASATDIIAGQLRKAVEGTMFEVDGKTVRCTITIGAINVTQPAQVLTGLDLAFRAMVDGRQNDGMNRIHWFHADAGIPGVATGDDADRSAMLERINQAIDHNRFLLLFQPTISLRGDSDEHYEVFLRMLDEHGNQIRPDRFLQIAIDHGVARKIDRWVILRSIKLLSAHRAKGHDTRLTVNLTSNSLQDTEFGQWLAVAIKAARLPSDAVIFQIAEPDTSLYMRQARTFVEGLRAMHCRSSLSHFGASKNAFDTLRHVPVDFVKFDGALMRDVDQEGSSRNRLSGMIGELQALGKLTVVPMVESATELAALWQAGANYIQGNYLQEPSMEMSYDFASDD
jgi:multidomain signaling protein FimX